MFHNFGPERKVVAEPGFEQRQTLYQSPNESHDNISSVRQCNHWHSYSGTFLKKYFRLVLDFRQCTNLSIGHESRPCTNICSITTVTALKRGDNKPFYYSPLDTLYVNVIIIIMMQVQSLDHDVCQNCKMTRSQSLTALLPLLFSRCYTALHFSNTVKMHWCLPDGWTIRGSHLT